MVAGAARMLPHRRRGPAIDAVRRRVLDLHGRRDRMAIYFAFGLPNDATRTFAERNMARQLEQLGQPHAELPEQVATTLAQAGLKVLDM
jgi:hypothetical protein